jgi:hypothetical protein
MRVAALYGPGHDGEGMRAVLIQLSINESTRAEIIASVARGLGLPLQKKPDVCLTERTENPLEMLHRDKEGLDRIIGSYKRILFLAGHKKSDLLTHTFKELLVQEEAHGTMLGRPC